MKKIIFSAVIILFASFNGYSVKMPGVILQNIPVKIAIHSNDLKYENKKIFFISESDTVIAIAQRKDERWEWNAVLPKTGKIKIISESDIIQPSTHYVYPAWVSILPPLIAIGLALIIKEVLISLLIGIFVGAIFFYNFNLLEAFLRTIDTIIPSVLLDFSHINIVIFSMMIGGLVGIVSKNGGMEALANLMMRKIKSRVGALLGTFASGLIIFFDDYTNSLIVGNIARPLCDKFKISREKLAFIVDSTAAPIASIAVIGTWIGYEVGIIQEALNSIGLQKNAYLVFLNTLSYRFYPFCMIFFIFATIILKRDMFSMYRAEKRALEKGLLYEENAKIPKDLTGSDENKTDERKTQSWILAALPIVFLIISAVVCLIYSGIQNLKIEKIEEVSLKEIISASDPYVSLLWSSFASCLFAGILSVSFKSLKFKDAIDSWFIGVRSMLYAMLILTFAWSLGSTTKEMQTAEFLVSILKETINPYFVPSIIFIICAAISFATGTSWGTLSIVMPLAIPLSYNISLNAGLPQHLLESLLLNSIASVLAGSIWGDHCSPIADTTVLSAMASSCDLIDHVNTQLPYAILVGAISLIFGNFFSSFFSVSFPFILLCFFIIFNLIWFLGKKI